MYFCKRRVFHVIYELADAVTKCSTSTDTKQAHLDPSLPRLKAVWEMLNAQLGAYEIVQWAMEQVPSHQAMPKDLRDHAAEAVWWELQKRLEYVLTVDQSMEPLFALASGCSEPQRVDLHTLLGNRIEGFEKPGATLIEPQWEVKNLLQRLNDHTRQLLEKGLPESQRALIDEWESFMVQDAHFFPIDYFGELGEKDEIDVVRVSPFDATRAFCARKFEDKVTGETVMHFGAFLKRSWRSNDIMWGRLDGVCRIFDTLLTSKALEESLESVWVRDELRRELAGELDPASLFPNAGKEIQGRMRAWMLTLAADDKPTRAAAIADNDMKDLLLACAQLEILSTDMPTVLVDAATEQLEWNNIRKEGATEFEPLGRIDLGSAIVAGEEITRAFISELKSRATTTGTIFQTPVAQHFAEQYKVGAETPGSDIPPAVLFEVLTSALLVARNCLVNAFPARAAKVTGSLPYKLFVHWPLTIAHTLAMFARREPPFYLATISALMTYASRSSEAQYRNGQRGPLSSA